MIAPVETEARVAPPDGGAAFGPPPTPPLACASALAARASNPV
jgi:hypothetical protein